MMLGLLLIGLLKMRVIRKIKLLKMVIMIDCVGAHIPTLYQLANHVNASFKIRATVATYGVYNLEQLKAPSDTTRKMITLSINREKYRAASPVHDVDSTVVNPAFDTSFLLTWCVYG